VGSQENSVSNFGLLIAYVLPGFTALQGLPFLSHTVPTWGIGSGEAEPSLPGFLYGTIEAVTAGLTVSTVRWLMLDALHHHTGVRPPPWDFRLLEKNVAAFELLVHIHYRYYKFYGNMVVALIWRYFLEGRHLGWPGLVYWMFAGLFFLGSRDTLRKYYTRGGQLLSRHDLSPAEDVG
jgi:hypothetical protein